MICLRNNITDEFEVGCPDGYMDCPETESESTLWQTEWWKGNGAVSIATWSFSPADNIRALPPSIAADVVFPPPYRQSVEGRVVHTIITVQEAGAASIISNTNFYRGDLEGTFVCLSRTLVQATHPVVEGTPSCEDGGRGCAALKAPASECFSCVQTGFALSPLTGAAPVDNGAWPDLRYSPSASHLETAWPISSAQATNVAGIGGRPSLEIFRALAPSGLGGVPLPNGDAPQHEGCAAAVAEALTASGGACGDNAPCRRTVVIEELSAIIDLDTGAHAWSCHEERRFGVKEAGCGQRSTAARPEWVQPARGSWLGASGWNPHVTAEEQLEQPAAGCVSEQPLSFVANFNLTRVQAACLSLSLRAAHAGDLVDVRINGRSTALRTPSPPPTAPPAPPLPPAPPFSPPAPPLNVLCLNVCDGIPPYATWLLRGESPPADGHAWKEPFAFYHSQRAQLAGNGRCDDGLGGPEAFAGNLDPYSHRYAQPNRGACAVGLDCADCGPRTVSEELMVLHTGPRAPPPTPPTPPTPLPPLDRQPKLHEALTPVALEDGALREGSNTIGFELAPTDGPCGILVRGQVSRHVRAHQHQLNKARAPVKHPSRPGRHDRQPWARHLSQPSPTPELFCTIQPPGPRDKLAPVRHEQLAPRISAAARRSRAGGAVERHQPVGPRQRLASVARVDRRVAARGRARAARLHSWQHPLVKSAPTLAAPHGASATPPTWNRRIWVVRTGLPWAL